MSLKRKKPRGFTKIKYFAAVVVIVFGLFKISMGWQIHHKAALSERWPTADGVIIASHLVELEGGTHEKKYEVYVRYAYSVASKTFTDDTISFKRYPVDTLTGASAVLKRYPLGHHVKVFYDPTEPSHGVLEPGMPWKADVPLFVGLGFLAAGLGYLWMLIRKGRGRP